jgi:hypothetical protein
MASEDPPMTSWNDVLAEAPELGALVQQRFEAVGLAFLATIRSDGSPRITGIETAFFDGQLCMGSMWEARKALDLRRDPRMALHAASVDKEVTDGDAKVAGRAVEVDDQAWKAAFAKRFEEDTGFDPEANGPWHLFTVDVAEVSFLKSGGDHLDIDLWTPGTAPRRIERR